MGAPGRIRVSDDRFEMKVDLAVLQSLGINLYSNAAAVLSEVVANAWDADANEISIHWGPDGDTITIEDDGIGMSVSDLNAKYLKVGYQKRSPDNDGKRSPRFNRLYMGRKGIGKLSVFSLANDVLVETRKDGEDPQALRITRAGLESAIGKGEAYHPEVEQAASDLPDHGTRITLKSLNAKRAGITVKALRRKLARRFDVMQFDSAADDRFRIVVNGDPVGFADRADLARIEYFWSFGPTDIPADKTPKVRKRWELNGAVDEARGWRLSGWFGAVSTPADLQDADDSQESLRNMIIMARKRPIQEGILDQLHFNKLFGSYVTGQVTAEFLDLDDELPDIATSDRQRLIEDDERSILLRQVLRERFLEAERLWSEQRPKDKFRDLLVAYPEVHEWVENRGAQQRTAAKKLVETIAGLTLDDEGARRELFRAGILGFERVALDATTAQLNEFADSISANDVLPVLASQRSLEDALYGQILRSRIAAIDQLERLINKDELERALQEHLFDNMWLLDPSWEHPTADAVMEQNLKRIRADVFDPTEEANAEQGRIDIKYRTAAGTHIIVEMKRYGRKCGLDELFNQGGKYVDAIRDVLDRTGKRSDGKDVEVVFILGAKLDPGYIGVKTADEVVEDRLDAINGRVLYYDDMLTNARRQYVAYGTVLDEKNNDLAKVLASLSDPPGTSGTEVVTDDTAEATPQVTAPVADQHA